MYWWIAAGGVAGTFARYWLQGAVQQVGGAGFPWGTLAVNVTGSLLIGFLARFGTGAAAMDPQVRAGLLIGFCGAFTTFSTYSYETVQLLADGLWVRAAAYALGSVLLSLVGTLAGIGMAERLL